jgi:hypothetical protein
MLWAVEEFVDDYQLLSSCHAPINLRRNVDWEYFYDELSSPVVRLCRILGAPCFLAAACHFRGNHVPTMAFAPPWTRA